MRHAGGREGGVEKNGGKGRESRQREKRAPGKATVGVSGPTSRGRPSEKAVTATRARGPKRGEVDGVGGGLAWLCIGRWLSSNIASVEEYWPAWKNRRREGGAEG